MMPIREALIIYLFIYGVLYVNTYDNSLFNLIEPDGNLSIVDCGGFSNPQPIMKYMVNLQDATSLHLLYNNTTRNITLNNWQFKTVAPKINVEIDPMVKIESKLNAILFGSKHVENDKHSNADGNDKEIDMLAQAPSGSVMRAELFQNKSAVHLPMSRWMHRGHCYLNMTMDYMQTAVNAFAIFLEGTIDDVLRLPPAYVLRSARTIAMMKIAREKLVATWTVIKSYQSPEAMSYRTLEYYRPLFKYVSGREIAKLNLEDERILTYIGTHPDLDRHQVGVVASHYIKINKEWRTPKYLNLMNNLLCGVPMKLMRKIPENYYLQLSHQIFYHIRACDPLQRRFYLAMMTRTQVLGKANSWSARDVARLGLLLTEVDGPDLSAINPEAMAGITSQVMMEMGAQNLKHLTKMQLKYLAQKQLNILTKKVNKYNDGLKILNLASKSIAFTIMPFIYTAIKIISKRL